MVPEYSYNFPIANEKNKLANPALASDGKNTYLIVWEDDGNILGQLIESIDEQSDYNLSCK